MNYAKLYHNNVTEATADCGCKIVLSRQKYSDELKDPFRWVKFCDEHEPKEDVEKVNSIFIYSED